MNYDKLLLSTLSQDAYYQVNKELIKKLGLINAIVLSFLVDKKKYFIQNDMLGRDGGFFLSAAKLKKEQGKKNLNVIEYELKIGEVARRSAFRELAKRGLIKIKKIGHPARHYYYVNSEKILTLISSSDTQVEVTSDTQVEVTSDTQVEVTSDTQVEVTYNKNKEQKQINNAEKLTSSKFIEYKNRLRAIDEKFNLSYLESSKANQYYEQAQKKYEELNSNKSFSVFFESILAKLEKLTTQKLDRFAFKQGFTIESLVKFDLQGCAKVEAWFNDCYPQVQKIYTQTSTEKKTPAKFSDNDLNSLKEFLA